MRKNLLIIYSLVLFSVCLISCVPVAKWTFIPTKVRISSATAVG